MRVALLFIDGVGVGPVDPLHNPLTDGAWLVSQFNDGSGTALPNDGVRTDLDTTFGVAGRPQSASNQTAIYTGLPAPKLVGEHVLGFPTDALRKLIADSGVVKRALAANRSVSFTNAYPTGYLDALGLPRDAAAEVEHELPAKLARRLRPSASALTFSTAGQKLRTFTDARNDTGLTHDIDGSLAIIRDTRLPQRTPERAAEIFWSLSADFTLFEHFLADQAGHACDRAAASTALATFDAFARAVIDTRPSDTLVLICSDHGNVEDLSSKHHTTNNVALLHFGALPSASPPLHDLADVGRLIAHVLEAA